MIGHLTVTVLYFVLFTSHCASDDQVWKNTIHVNTLYNNTNCSHSFGTQLEDTQSDITVCPTLNTALRHFKNSSVIRLSNGNHSLARGDETTIKHMSDIAIIGSTSDKVNIICNAEETESAGISFINSYNITLSNFTITKCYQFQYSTSLDYNSTNPFSYMKIPVSIYMLLCQHVTIANVTIMTYNASGMILYNTGGTVSILESSFNENSHRPGGGGLQIEFSYCIAGDYSCINSTSSQIGQGYSSNTNYTINSCKFANNIAYLGFAGLRKMANIGKNSFSLSRGGGLGIVFKGNASQNSLVINNCNITKNRAHMGGGFYISFHDNASNNTVYITDSSLNGNLVHDIQNESKMFNVDGGGGGGKVIFDNGRYGQSSNNSVFIVRSNFTSNLAISGGGLWVETNLNKHTGKYDRVFIENCVFTKNSAFLGSGIYLSNGFRKKTVHVSLRNVDFLSNAPRCSHTVKYSFLPCSGIFYSINVPFSISGTNKLMNNTASAIEVHEAIVTINDSAILHFENNISPYGSALAFYDCCQMMLHKNTSLKFVNNTALVAGGAIYAGSCSGGSQPADASSECFIQYIDETSHPDKWNTSLIFHNNTNLEGPEGKNDSIFSVSLPACWWPKENESFIYIDDDYTNLRQTFCWKPWKYNGTDCQKEVSSGPALLDFNKETFTMKPGGHIQLPVVRDGSFTPINKTLIACIEYGPASFAIEYEKTCKKVHFQRVNLYYHGDKEKYNDIVHISMKIFDTGPGGLFEPSFDVNFEHCEFPLIFNGVTCLYKLAYFCCDKDCDNDRCGIGSIDVTPKPQYCIGNSKKEVAIGHCPVSYNGFPKFNSTDFSILTECGNGHSGLLCGKCKDGYGVPVNSLYYTCVDCSKSRFPGFLLFLLLELIPVSFLVAIIIIFNIKLTDGILIGFVFYCQIVSLNFPVWVYPTWFTNHHAFNNTNLNRFVTIPYRMFNLDFMTLYPISALPICITNHMDPLHAIVFSYLTPLYCLVLLLFVTIWLISYEQGMTCVVKITRPFHKCLARFWSFLKINPSLMESLASVYILSFTPLASTSLKLLHYTTWHSVKIESEKGKAFLYDAEYDYFGFPHALAAIFAICLLTFLCILPAVFLLLYPYQKFHKFLDMIKVRHQVVISFADINTGALCDGSKQTKDFRFFAGVYLLLRLFIMCFYYIPGQYSSIILYLETIISLVFGGVIMIFRPFKKPFVNFANFMIFALLGAMSGICLAVDSGRFFNLVFLMHVPLLFALCYLLYHFRKRFIAHCSAAHKVKSKYRAVYSTTANSITHIEEETDYDSDHDDGSMNSVDNWPDRIENPQDYSSDRSQFEQNEGRVRLLSSGTMKTNFYGSAQ